MNQELNLSEIWTNYAETYNFFYAKTLKETHKIVAKKIGERHLDLGCGVGKLATHISNKNYFYGIDSSKEMIKIAKENFKQNPKITFSLGDVTYFISQNKYDSISSVNVIYSLKNIEKINLMLQNSTKNLVENGVIILSTLNTSFNPKKLEEMIFQECKEQVRDEKSEEMFQKFIKCNKILANQNKNYVPLLLNPQEMKQILKENNFWQISSPVYFAEDMSYIITAKKA